MAAVRARFLISWQLDGAREFCVFEANNKHDFLKQLASAWNQAVDKGADLAGNDEPILELSLKSFANHLNNGRTISFAIGKNGKNFLAKTDDEFETEEWEALDISLHELGDDSDPEKIMKIFEKISSLG